MHVACIKQALHLQYKNKRVKNITLDSVKYILPILFCNKKVLALQTSKITGNKNCFMFLGKGFFAAFFFIVMWMKSNANGSLIFITKLKVFLNVDLSVHIILSV